MTLLAERGPTATGPTVRSTFRQARGPVVVVLALVLTAILLAVVSAGSSAGRLDPDSYTPTGSRAIAEVLRDQGVPVTRVDTVEAAVAGDRADRTVVIGVPQALAPGELQQLAELDARLVVVGPNDEQLADLGLPAEVDAEVEVDRRRPACELDVAARAGEVDLGGLTYRADAGTDAAGCYAAGGAATLLDLPEPRASVLGDGTVLTNGRLAERGNAALAYGLLSREEGGVLWLVPRPGRPVPDGEQPSLSELLPDGLLLGALQLLVAVAVLALWRARRLGRVVEEPLPVVVRAAETVEGRSRLYRAAQAQGSAAEAVRAATRERLARRVGLPAAADRRMLVTVVAKRTGRDARALDALLYGGAPPDDAALVRLVTDLRTLESVLTTT